MSDRTQCKAKFYVERVEMMGHAKGKSGNVVLKAVSRGAENAMWASASPSGEMKMYVANPAGFQWFVDRLGQEVSLTMCSALIDPATHAFQGLEYDEDIPHAIGATPTCVHCGMPESAHV